MGARGMSNPITGGWATTMCTEELSVWSTSLDLEADAFPSALVVGRLAFSRSGIKLHLERDGIPVAGEVEELNEVLDAVQRLKPILVFFDLFQIDKEEFRLIARLRSEFPDTRVGLFVSNPSVDHLKQALWAGVSAFMTKGFSMGAPLRSIVRHMLNGGLIIDPKLLAEFVASIPLSQLQPTQDDVALLSMLSDRDREIMRLVAHGASAPNIADALNISPGTVRNRLTKIYRLLGVTSRSGAAAFAVRSGLTS